MTPIPTDMTPVYKATIAKGTSATRWQRAVYVDVLPPCNNAYPAGLNIQARLALAQAGRYEEGVAQVHRVLVVGAGPAGLSCVFHLRRLGHEVEIRDGAEEPGGMMRYGMLAYRAPAPDRFGVEDQPERPQ